MPPLSRHDRQERNEHWITLEQAEAMRRAERGAGSSLCAGGCGRIVSGNKEKCLRCLAEFLKADFRAREVQFNEADILHQLRQKAGV